MSQIIDLKLNYKIFKKKNNSILNNLSLQIMKGEKIAIMGPSGIGKTSLLNILGLIDDDYDGELKIFGQLTKKLSNAEKAQLRNKNIGFVLQESALIDSLSLEENIKLPFMYGNLNRDKKSLKFFDEIIEIIGLKSILQNKPHECSGGQRARATFARGVIMNPELILSDEPTAFLDVDNKKRIVEILFDLNEKYNTTIVTVTHEIDLALQHDRIIQIERKE